jgi:hypothetical protein
LKTFRESDHQVLCFWTEREKAVAGMVPAIEKARLYRGKGGEYTALVEIHLSPKIQKILHDSLDENLKHPNAEIQVGSSVLFEL